MAVIGMDLSGTRVSAALYEPAGAPGALVRSEASLAGAGGSGAGRVVCGAIRELVQAAKDAGGTVEAVGVSVAGTVRPDGVVAVRGLEGWEAYPLRRELEAALRRRCSLRLLGRPAACLLGECWRGAVGGCRDAVYLEVGTEIGAGILVDGALLRGSGELAGGVAWMALARPWLEPYRRLGCFQFHASGRGLAEVARLLLSATPRYEGPLRAVAPEALTADHVFAALEQRDSLAAEVLSDAVAYWGMASANLVSLFNPQRIVFGGDLFGPALKLLVRIRGEAERWAQPAAMRQVEFVAGTLPDAPLWGAVRLALDTAAAEPAPDPSTAGEASGPDAPGAPAGTPSPTGQP